MRNPKVLMPRTVQRRRLSGIACRLSIWIYSLNPAVMPVPWLANVKYAELLVGFESGSSKHSMMPKKRTAGLLLQATLGLPGWWPF